MPSGEYQPHTNKPIMEWTEEDFVAWIMTVLVRDGETGGRPMAEAILDRILTNLMIMRQCTREEALEIHRQRIHIWQGKGVMTDGRHR